MAESVDNMTDKELVEQLGRLEFEVTSSRAVLRERLRKALNIDTTVNTHKVPSSAGISGGGASSIYENIDGAHERSVGTRWSNDTHVVRGVDTMSKKELQEELGKLGLSVKGLKVDLIQRLKTVMREGVTDEDGEDDESEEYDKEETNVGHFRDDRESITTARGRGGTEERAVRAPPYDDNTYHGREREHSMARQSTLSFKDVEDALETFRGDGTQNVRR